MMLHISLVSWCLRNVFSLVSIPPYWHPCTGSINVSSWSSSWPADVAVTGHQQIIQQGRKWSSPLIPGMDTAVRTITYTSILAIICPISIRDFSQCHRSDQSSFEMYFPQMLRMLKYLAAIGLCHNIIHLVLQSSSVKLSPSPPSGFPLKDLLSPASEERKGCDAVIVQTPGSDERKRGS